MNRAEKFKEQNDKLYVEVTDYIDSLLSQLLDTDLSDADIVAYAIIDDFDAGHVGVFEITRVNSHGILFGVLDDEEEDIPFDMMTNESLIELAGKLEAYVDVHG